jgi:hypothetical protein
MRNLTWIAVLLLPGDQFLRIRKLERMRQDFAVAQILEAGQDGPDLRGNRIIAVAVPSQHKLRLLPEILEVRHGRATIEVS